MKMWADKPYRSLDYHLKERYGEKVYKISLEIGMTCPNRDGTLDTRGCIFCSGDGSGDFAVKNCGSLTDQIDQGIAGISARKHTGNKFIAYFQSFTNTYERPEVLEPIFQEALAHPQIVGLAIGTRPDCLPVPISDLLDRCQAIKPVWIELGLQTIHQSTANYIRRGYSLSVFQEAVDQLSRRNIETVVHVIVGLPGETKEMFLDTIKYLSKQPIQGIKLQLLHVLRGTDLEKHMGQFHILSMEEYLTWITEALVLLPPHITIHRLTGDGPKDLLIAPLWSSKKRHVLNSLHKQMANSNLWQGKVIPHDK